MLFVCFYAVYITVIGGWRDFWLMFLLGIGMVMFFWFPALYEQKYVIFNSVQISNPAAYFITPSNVLLVGFSGIIAACLSIFIGKKFIKEKSFFLIAFFCTLFLVLPMSGFLWKSGILIRIIQFPYRLLSLVIFIGCWLMAYIVEYTQRPVRYFFLIVIITLGIWSVEGSFLKIQYTDVPEGYYVTNEATSTVADEYMPRWVSQKPTQHAYQKLIFYKGAGTFDVKKISTQSIQVVVHATQDSVVQMNTMYYPGWGVTLDDAPVLIDYKNNQGLIRVVVPKGDHQLRAGFRETISRFLADNISLGFFIWYGIAVLVKKKHT